MIGELKVMPSWVRRVMWHAFSQAPQDIISVPYDADRVEHQHFVGEVGDVEDSIVPLRHYALPDLRLFVKVAYCPTCGRGWYSFDDDPKLRGNTVGLPATFRAEDWKKETKE